MYCQKCGKKLIDGATFCDGCGASLQNKAVQTTATPAFGKRWNSFALSALIGAAGYLVLILMIRIVSNKFGIDYADALSTTCTIFCAISGLVLAIGAFVYFKSNTGKEIPCVVALVSEVLLLLLLLIFVDPFLRLFNVPAETFSICVSGIRVAVLVGIFSTIIAGPIGLLVEKKSIKLDSIVYAVVLLLSVITLLVGHRLFGFIPIAISLGLFQPFFSILPCSLQGATRKTEPQEVQIPAVQQITFCPSCGMQFPYGKKFCDQCGAELKETTGQVTVAYPNSPNSKDAPSGGFAALGFFFPVIGFVLYLVWKDTLPNRAKSVGKGSLIGVVTWVLAAVLLPMLYLAILSSLL